MALMLAMKRGVLSSFRRHFAGNGGGVVPERNNFGKWVTITTVDQTIIRNLFHSEGVKMIDKREPHSHPNAAINVGSRAATGNGKGNHEGTVRNGASGNGENGNGASGNGANGNGNGGWISLLADMRKAFDVGPAFEWFMTYFHGRTTVFLVTVAERCYHLASRRSTTGRYPDEGFLPAPQGELKFRVIAPGEENDMMMKVNDKKKTFTLEMNTEEWKYKRVVMLPEEANYENATYSAIVKKGALYVSVKGYEPKTVKILLSDDHKKPSRPS